MTAEHMSRAQRHTYINNTLEHARVALDIPAVQDRLGDKALELARLVDDSEFVGVDHEGMVELGEDRLGKFALTVVATGERTMRSAASHFLSDTQRERVLEAHGSQGLRDVTAAIRARAKDEPLHVFDRELGYVTASPVDMGDGWTVRGRPLMVLNRDTSIYPFAAAPLFLHEATHMLQRTREPVFNVERGLDPVRRSIKDELEAYSDTAQVILGIQGDRRASDLLSSISPKQIEWALAIEDVRKQHANPDEPYAPTNRVAAAMVDARLGITPALQKIIKGRQRRVS